MSQRIRLERFSLKDLLEGKNISAIDETSLEEIAFGLSTLNQTNIIRSVIGIPQGFYNQAFRGF